MIRKIFISLIYGAAAFFMVAVLAITESYVRCLFIGVKYDLISALPTAAKGGAVAGIAIMILTFVGTPKSEGLRKK